MSISYNKVREAREAAEHVAASYLYARGWRHSSINPACTWLWSKALPDGGGVVWVDQDTAVSLQARADGISLKHWPKP